MENVAHETEKAISGAIKIDEKEIQDHIDGLVRPSVEDTLNALLNAEADAICNASRYQRTPDRLDTRAGSYHRKLLSKAGEVDLKVPRLRSLIINKVLFLHLTELEVHIKIIFQTPGLFHPRCPLTCISLGAYYSGAA